MKFIKINFKLKMWFHENKVTLEICVYFKFSLDILIGKHRKKQIYMHVEYVNKLFV